MADSNFVLSRGFDAETALTKFRAVKPGTVAEAVQAVSAEGDEVLGVAQYTVTTAELARGKGASVAMMGVTEMETSEAIAVGDTVAISADGRAAAVNSGARNIGVCVGNAADGAGDRISVLLQLPGTVTA